MKKKEKGLRDIGIKRLVVICSFSAVLLMVATFAWFIGMRTVDVSSFDVQIASTDSLLLSLDGKKWSAVVEISRELLDEVSYEGHTNSWGGAGLVPMSSVGEMDTAISRMKLFDKTSLTATPGGYRLIASRIDNSGPKEYDGYVVFDLFVKNFSGRQYITENNQLNEEAIYLTVDSKVEAGSGYGDTGIENSIRVAFTQVGRVSGATTNVSDITGISCKTEGVVTGICRTAQIWEPNDTKHNQNALNWYKASCLKRTKEDLTKKDSYSGACNELSDGVAYPTYAVKADISSADKIDIYDGEEYNTYSNKSTLVQKLTNFTDEMKDAEGIEREEFFSLAPNSITKVRIYIYIEGQDIDNYDFAAIGKQVSIQFGFTKERFTEDDIDYQGPDLDEAYDQEKPVITLKGDETVTIARGSVYTDAGATATDNLEGDVSHKIIVSNPVNTEIPGTYTIKYNVRDWAGNYADQVIRTVIVTE